MEEKKTVILFTGDSITDGNRYKKKELEWDLNHQMGHSYAYIINGLLGALYPGKRFWFRNRGISGNKVRDLYERREEDLFALKPDVLSILVGVNDGPGDSSRMPTPGEEYEKVYRKMIEEVQERLPDCKLILMEPFVCNAGHLREEYAPWRKAMEGYGRTVRKIASDHGALFVPLQQVFDQKCREVYPEYWSWDGVHPTENGHGLIAMEWMRQVAPLLGLDNSGKP